MNKNTFIVGFMLFAIFFGAGNLIFPPKLGLESGEHIWLSALGFIVTGVGLPLLGIIVSAFYSGGYSKALKQIHPWFSLFFLSAIYLSIGPFLAIPRTAATSFEIALQPFLQGETEIPQLIFTSLFFILSLWLALSPSKMVARVGSILTPALLISIAALVIKVFFALSDVDYVSATTTESMFFKGFVSGYLTMDALASVAFSVIVISAIQSKGVNQKQLVQQTIYAGIIAAGALALIYLSLAWIGSKSHLSEQALAYVQERNLDMGTYLLNDIAQQTFGELGRMILGIIVTLACLTTSIGLIVSVSEYFYEIYHKISYKIYALFFTVISFIIANQGLSTVLSKSVPVLLVLYPIAITVILLMFINIFINLPLLAQRLSIGLVSIISLCSVLGVNFTAQLPLKAYSMEWVIFSIIGLIFGYFLDIIVRKRA
ncbi:branched-chain amino acid transport system II carrier protein [Lonepinella koalarum]|uniref:Branched-chain amino acid transport system carrier protein n=1 Tax=Lonepinella koalarum TaxID=53417 RepID=A0A4V2PUB7_9PAST|nr:branched-chain amino acid transport system II carrier protein [Lonepinella koalarum]MDH2927746.1 branched-chain amino acid ABC transporter substrate-binding protein [Lonepinella koalarum]TCK69941.1 LIVCS family branched-chain amino acid:cation transporter [Lonepinella koalarum]TFJ90456.1 branched-chain amino acid transport system II carrier protein [Lonepinella koalarum]TYG35152.1 branched-chain amino acid transport system II carrier protein [Lonepinella koalarum]